MSAVAFDTHQAFRNLEKAGVSKEHAEAIIDVVSQSQDDLATKHDLKIGLLELENKIDGQGKELNDRIDSLEQRMNGRMDGLEQEIDGKLEKQGLLLLIRLGGLMIAMTGLIVSVIKGWV